MEAISQHQITPVTDYSRRLYASHYRGAWLRIGGSLFMLLFAFGAYLLDVIKINNLAGISAAVAFLILINPLALWTIKRLKSRRLSDFFSLFINLLEVIGYTAAIYFLGGIRALWLSPIYAVLIGYIGTLGPPRLPFLVAGFCGAGIASMVGLEYLGIIPNQDPIYNVKMPGAYQVVMVVTSICFLQVVAFVSAYTGGLLRRGKTKLRERNVQLQESNESLKHAKQELGEAYQTLEKRAEERTAELKERSESLKSKIEEHKLSEEALKRSEEKFRTMMEAMKDPIYICSPDFRVEYMNPAMIRRTGRDATGENCFKALHDLDEKCPWCMHDKAQQGDYYVSEVVSPKDNRSYHVSSSPIFHGDGSISKMTVFRDTTDLKKLETQLQHAQRMEAVGTLAGGIAHDFNNLLMAIQGRASIMLMDKDSSHSDFGHLRGIEGHVESAADLTRQLLGFARGGKYEVKPTDLNELIKKQNRMFSRTKKEITIRGKYEENLWSVDVDRGQVEQVLLNLYVNAWQAMPGGGNLYLETGNVTLNKNYVKPFSIEPGRYVKISVTDTGVGMDKATRERIFDPFFTTKEMGTGTGLGLASAYGIIKNHGGFINVYTEKGHGSTFNIYLPAIQGEGLRQRAESKIKKGIVKGDETVLLIDDEDMIIEVAEEMLEQLGYKVLIARSGKEAIETYKKDKEQIDIVVLDMVMPDMSGGEAYDKLKEINPDIKVLLASGYSVTGAATEILDRGCNGFIQKPVKMRALSQKLREILDC